ncbi:DUF6221 family protein [Streptomyces sp. NPDC001914]|uniref:DUF6221 family protein n=1 Tax=Streptomyces sp. NPDC001914 TaxID=3364623 RepID=UPI0036CE96A1
MPDLHGWITQQINETERLASRAAELCGCHPPAPAWSFRDGDEPSDGHILVVDEPHPGLKRKIGRRWNSSYEGLFMAEHIVRHDPAAVLRRCAADRRILAAHPYTTTVINPQDGSSNAGFGCETCHAWDAVPEGRGNCSTLLDLAEGYGLTEEHP